MKKKRIADAEIDSFSTKDADYESESTEKANDGQSAAAKKRKKKILILAAAVCLVIDLAVVAYFIKPQSAPMDDAKPEVGNAENTEKNDSPFDGSDNAEDPGASDDPGEPGESEETESEYSVGLEYTSNGDGTCYVNGIGTCTDMDIVIPPVSPSGEMVTSIGKYAFYNCDSLTSVTIPDSVTSIGDSAFFYCTGLTSVTISDSVTTIGDYAFYNCTSLTSVTIPDSVTSIGDSVFSWCSSLSSVTIGDGVASIGASAFSSCFSLTSVTIPGSVTSIGDYAFRYCSGLTSITVSADNEYYKSMDGNLYTKDGKTLIQYAIGKNDTEFTIPDGVTSIGNYAFRNCSSLTSVTIPDSVTSIGNFAFAWCSSLTSVTIPDSVTSIGDYAFSDCTSLTDIYYAGTSEQWDAISKGIGWKYNCSATVHYNYTPEE